MNPLERVRLEKAATDHGFDLTPVTENGWVLCRSSQWPLRIWLAVAGNEHFALALSDRKALEELTRHDAPERLSSLPSGSAGSIEIAGFRNLYTTLARVAALARSLPTQVAERFRNQTRGLPHTTEAERLVVQRVGQQLFREALIDYWGGACAVTGLAVAELLRASHIKPWAACASDEERLDVFNGLLLAPHLDALFDGGWMTFDPSGVAVLSAALDVRSRERLHVGPELRLAWIAAEHDRYLEFHRGVVFKG